jgi:hypothetical protein
MEHCEKNSLKKEMESFYTTPWPYQILSQDGQQKPIIRWKSIVEAGMSPSLNVKSEFR